MRFHPLLLLHCNLIKQSAVYSHSGLLLSFSNKATCFSVTCQDPNDVRGDFLGAHACVRVPGGNCFQAAQVRWGSPVMIRVTQCAGLEIRIASFPHQNSGTYWNMRMYSIQGAEPWVLKRLSGEGFGGRTPVPRARRKNSKDLLKKKKRLWPEQVLHGSLCMHAYKVASVVSWAVYPAAFFLNIPSCN